MEMKTFDLILLGIAGYLLFRNRTTPGSDPQSSQFMPLSIPGLKEDTKTTGATIPSTAVRMSSGFLGKVISSGYTPSNIVAAAKAPIPGGITVTKPTTNAQGLTAWDLRIRENFKLSGAPYPYKN